MTAQPDEVIHCSSIKLHPQDSRVACLLRKDEIVAWLMLVDAAACTSFIAAALPMIQASPTELELDLQDSKGHSVGRQLRAASQLQMEEVQAQLERHETELAFYRSRFADESGAAVDVESIVSRHSLPARVGGRARSPSCSSSDEEEPLVPSVSADVVMDWPLSKAEKKLRLIQIMDRERVTAQRQNRRLKRRSSR